MPVSDCKGVHQALSLIISSDTYIRVALADTELGHSESTQRLDKHYKLLPGNSCPATRYSPWKRTRLVNFDL